MISYPPQDLSALNTLAVPATADHFATATSIAEVQQACAWAREKGLRVLVLGGGSNVIPDSHIDALVLHPEIKGVTTVKADSEHQWIDVGAGEDWHPLVLHCLEQGWYGLENLSLIPGTAGAAPIQNIGAYGVELSEFFDSLQAIEIATGREEIFDLGRCAFGYRDSVFKNALRGRYVVTSIRLRLSRVPRVLVRYPALADALAGLDEQSLTPRHVSEAVCALRRSKLPDPAEVPNSGSFFKNPVISREHYGRLREQYPDVVAYEAGNGRKKLAAGWLIEKAGWKGRSYEGVVVHAQQALVLTNPRHLSGEMVLAAAAAIQEDVFRLFRVSLEIEPQRLR